MTKTACLFIALWFCFCAYVFSNEGISVIQLLLTAGITGAWVVFIGARLAFSFWRPVALEFLLIFVILGVSMTGIFGVLRFMVSEPALDQYVTDVRAGKITPTTSIIPGPTTRVGIYRVGRTELLPDQTVRIITSEDMFDQAGFAHSLSGAPMRQGEDSYTPMGDHWFHWHESW